jgi:hypothetical protein
MESKRYYIVINPDAAFGKKKVVEGRSGLHFALLGTTKRAHYIGPFFSKPAADANLSASE